MQKDKLQALDGQPHSPMALATFFLGAVLIGSIGLNVHQKIVIHQLGSVVATSQQAGFATSKSTSSSFRSSAQQQRSLLAKEIPIPEYDVYANIQSEWATPPFAHTHLMNLKLQVVSWSPNIR
jgi:hypothetical protein